MRISQQLTLFGLQPGRGRLFSQPIISRYLDEHRAAPITDSDAKIEILEQWAITSTGSIDNETTLEQQFIAEIFCKVLGYTLYPDLGGGSASVMGRPPTRVTGIARPPNYALGAYTPSGQVHNAIIELKTPGTNLDRPQPTRKNESPVGQCFWYAQRILGVRWAIVSDMRVIRLYSVDSDAVYEEFDLTVFAARTQASRQTLRKLHALLHHTNLVTGGGNSTVAKLLEKSSERQLRIRDSFYRVYYDVRRDLFDAMVNATQAHEPRPARELILAATQRLLDRLLFIFYCQDHPDRLIAKDAIEKTVDAARSLPGPAPDKIYSYLKLLFREVDAGSTVGSGMTIYGYNGELFKDHAIVDHISLPDSLASKTYIMADPDSGERLVKGPWGLHIVDFWTDLNEHLLGHIFEESLSDLEDISSTIGRPLDDKLKERRGSGIYYTTNVLSDFLSASALQSLLDEFAPISISGTPEFVSRLSERLKYLSDIKIIDIACGSGAFLVSALAQTLTEYWKVRSTQDRYADPRSEDGLSLFGFDERASQAALLRDSIYGVDLLPQAVEIAKLALWLRSARNNEKVPDLSNNIITGDTLRDYSQIDLLLPNTYDLVLGNPPWGVPVESGTYAQICDRLEISADQRWDSWELFLLIGLRSLKEGGRIAYVVPDSFLYPDKERIRRLVFDSSCVEKIYNLGPDWFGPNVRMGTLVLQARKGTHHHRDTFQGLVLAGNLRKKAITGAVPLTQAEGEISHHIAISRVESTDHYDIELYRSQQDDSIIETIATNAISLSQLTIRGRGEEVNKQGVLWQCPSCLSPTVPGNKKKGGYNDKSCPECGLTLLEAACRKINLIESGFSSATTTDPFLDGDDINRRYGSPTSTKRIRLDVSGWPYKPEELYKGPKLLIRQAGVGISAALDHTNARCPQSIYIYKLKADELATGYKYEYLLGALYSRLMAYYMFTRFSEADPAKAHVKVTHDRLSSLPIPKVDFNSQRSKELHDIVVDNVARMLTGAPLGGESDRRIELALRELWQIVPEQAAHVNAFFYQVPSSQAVRDLYPERAQDFERLG